MDEENDSTRMGDSELSMSMNNEQSRSEKIELRKSYRRLIQETQDNKEDLIKPDNDGLMINIALADELFEKVKETREAALDARFMSLAVSIGAQKTSLLQTDLVAFQADEFIQKLITLMGGTVSEDTEDASIPDAGWEILADITNGYFTSVVPALHPLSGAFESNSVTKPTKTRRLAEEGKNDRAQLPQQVTNYRSDKKEATPEEIERVFKIIRGLYAMDQMPIDYFELVANPDSFGHTIENIFHVAFLIKDGLVKMYLNDNGLPVVEPLPAVDAEAAKDQTITTGEGTKENCNQVIVSLSYNEWKQIIDAYKLEGKQPYISAGT